jgi:ABC-type transporter Mla subunit MlaD
MTDYRRRLDEKSDELLTEADRLDALERTIDALPAGSAEVVDVAEHAEHHAARLNDVAREARELSRDAIEPTDA